MMKKLAIVCAMLLAGVSAHAIGGIKLVQFGVKAGLSTQELSLRKTSGNSYSLAIDSRPGFHVGIMGRVNLLAFHIQPEIIYQSSRYDFDATEGVDSHARVRLSTWDFPVMLGAKFLFFRLQAGPVFNMTIDNSVKPRSGSTPHIMFSRSPVAYAAGIGADILKFTIDLRYNGQFKTPVQNIAIDSDPAQDVKTRMNNWMFSVGYLF